MSQTSPRTSDEESPTEVDKRPSNTSPVHRDSDGNALAVSLTLSPEQIAAIGLDDSVDRVRPIVQNGVLYVEPAD